MATTRTATATLDTDPDRVVNAQAQKIEEIGSDKAERRLGIAIHGTGRPTHDDHARLQLGL